MQVFMCTGHSGALSENSALTPANAGDTFGLRSLHGGIVVELASGHTFYSSPMLSD